MRRIAHLVHGFNVRDLGKGTTDRLVPYFNAAGFHTIQQDYGYLDLLRVRSTNHNIARILRANVRRGDVALGHSNGCAILAEAASMGAPFAGLVFVNPALDSDCVVAAHVPWVHVYFNRGDYAVWLATLLRFRHPWGSMGRDGFTGVDQRYRNIDCYPDLSGHSSLFDNAETWGPRIIANVLDALPKRRARVRDQEPPIAMKVEPDGAVSEASNTR